MKYKIYISIVVIILIIFGIVSTITKERTIDNSLVYIDSYDVRKKAPEFKFLNHLQKSISDKDYEGKVYVVEFFFTTCPSICPIMNKNLISIQNEFINNDDFGIASFTINPIHDTPEVLNDFRKKNGIEHKNWHLLTGEIDSILNLASEGYRVHVSAERDDISDISHSGDFILIDKKGYIRSREDKYGNPIIYYKGMILEENSGESRQEITMLKEDIKKLLNE